MTDWPVSVGRKQFKPIPESWVELGHDDGDEGTRIYAVSVAAVPDTRDVLAIRYVHPRSEQTLLVRTPGVPNPSGDGLVPASLAREHDWPRSRIADADPTGSARDAEMEHLRELWGERVAAIPAPGESVEEQRELVTDGGVLDERDDVAAVAEDLEAMVADRLDVDPADIRVRHDYAPTGRDGIERFERIELEWAVREVVTDGGRDVTSSDGVERERKLRRLVKRWRSRSKMFSEDDVVAKNCAELCADELEEVLGGET